MASMTVALVNAKVRRKRIRLLPFAIAVVEVANFVPYFNTLLQARC